MLRDISYVGNNQLWFRTRIVYTARYRKNTRPIHNAYSKI